MRDQERGSGGSFMASQAPTFLPFDCKYLENGKSERYIIELRSARRELSEI